MRTLNQNLFVESFRYTRKLLCNTAGRPLPTNPCLLFQSVNIPPVRGLGSSSSACVAGVLAGMEFVQAKYPEINMRGLLESLSKGPVGDHQIHEIQATLANRSDSNPDNVCAALVGGITYCYSDEDPADYHLNTSRQRLHFFRDAMEDESLRCLALVPTKELSTPQARQILAAERYKIDDVVFNLQRAASIPRIFHERRYELLREVTKDKIHQDQRARSLYTNDRGKAINIRYVFDAVMESGAYCAFISGAGSTLVALAHSSREEEVARTFREAFTEVAPDEWKIEQIMALRPTNQGASADGSNLRKLAIDQSLLPKTGLPLLRKLKRAAPRRSRVALVRGIAGCAVEVDASLRRLRSLFPTLGRTRTCVRSSATTWAD